MIEKLTPDRDLQSFFFHPSAIAAISGASGNGFTVSGTWRQQFDWAVVEWNRDNVYEHPALRNLPDGDLSGLVLTYEETRTNCIPLDSDLFPTVDWPSLRVWAGDDPAADPYFVPLKDHAVAIEGSYQSAYADFTLSGTAMAGEFVGLGYLGLSYTYQVVAGNTLDDIVQAITDGMNGGASPLLTATRTGTTIRVIYASTAGANGNRFGIYSSTSGSATWDAAAKTLANGTSPTKWRVTIDFSSLVDRSAASIPTNKVRKLRWTYAADQQIGALERIRGRHFELECERDGANLFRGRSGKPAVRGQPGGYGVRRFVDGHARKLLGRFDSLDGHGRRRNQLPVCGDADAHVVCGYSLHGQRGGHFDRGGRGCRDNG